MDALEDYFTAITVELPDAAAGSSEMQRFFGAYSAYANQAAAVDADRFRQRWRQQTHAFLDR
ncbi:MAG: hypothetical protein LIQ31_01875, partial [Planctomycetes bacterium]|nr:hypothetical protein [Planctomycetota bacterium]